MSVLLKTAGTFSSKTLEQDLLFHSQRGDLRPQLTLVLVFAEESRPDDPEARLGKPCQDQGRSLHKDMLSLPRG